MLLRRNKLVFPGWRYLLALLSVILILDDRDAQEAAKPRGGGDDDVTRSLMTLAALLTPDYRKAL